MAVTPNYNLNLPDFDSFDWHIPLNANFTTIDTEMQAIQDDLDAKFAEVSAARTSLVYTNESPFASLTLRIDEIEDELKDSRFDFTDAADRLKDYLTVGHLSTGANKPESFTALEFDTALIVNPVWVSTTSFKVDGDLRTTLKNGMVVRVDFAISGLSFAHIKDAAYAGGPDETTVTIWDDDPLFPGSSETINEVAYSFVKPNLNDPAFSPGADIRDVFTTSFEVFRYDGVAFDLPFDETAGRVAKTNTGRVARIDFKSGWQTGITYESAALDARIDSTDGVEDHINGTLFERFTPVYSGGLLTDMNRVFV